MTIVIAILLAAACNKKNKLSHNSNKEMIHILDSIARQNIDKDNPFSPEAQLTFYDGEIKKADTSNMYRFVGLEYYKASAFLKLGREKEAIDLFTQIMVTSPQMKKIVDMLQVQHSPHYFEMMEDFALANLRYGERTNCINNHMAESCVFPIKGMGMHQDETGSRKAIALYKDILKKQPADLASRWLLNIAYMTLGEYPEKVPPGLLIPGLDVYNSGVDVKPFTDIAANLKFDFKNNAGGAIIDDFNNDGYLDLVTSDWGLGSGGMHFFRNNANGSFTDVTAQSGLAGFTGGLNMVQADYNNDGYTDILVLRGGWLPGKFGKQPNSLLRNNGDGTFTDVTIESGLLSFHPTQTAVWKDFNNDGWLDLFIGNEAANPSDDQPCELYINNGNGTFTNMAKQAGCDVIGFVKGVTSADYNNDGWQDIFISTSDGRRMLLKNEGLRDGTVHFRNVTHEAGLDDIFVKTFPTWFWDYDNDGWPDIFVCGYQPGTYCIAYDAAAEALHQPTPLASKMYLYHNNHDGTFTNVSKEAGLDRSVFAMGSNFGDFDNDGYLDMYLGTGNPDYRSLVPDLLFKNMDGKKFVDVTAAARVGNLQKGHGVSFADLDNDGDQDIFIETGGAYLGDAYYNSFYLNPGQNENRWICLSLEGTKSNRSGIGARIKVTFNDSGTERSVYRDENSGGSFGCSPLRREIGIGKANIIDEIDITWPGSGETQTFKNIKPCQFLKIKQGSNTIEKVNLKTLHFERQDNGMKNMMAYDPSMVKKPPIKKPMINLTKKSFNKN
jgi:FG-GAP-like repeat/ASPIC and UnbV